MQYKVARGAMALIANQAKHGSLDTLGVSAEDFKKLSGDSPWMSTDRNRMNLVLSSLLSSTMDIIGVPRFQMPAEYIAAGIALFIAPINVQIACRFMERVPSAETLGRGLENSDIVTASQLFALVCQLVADPATSHAVILFERNTSIRIENAHIYGDKESEKSSGQKSKL